MIRAVVVGASGYAGAELLSLLLGHPEATVVGVFGSGSGDGGGVRKIGDLVPKLRGRLDLPVHAASDEEIERTRADAVFLATPHEASMELAANLVSRGMLVVDLSAAYRLKDASLYPRYYGFEHQRAALLNRAVYGLVEVYREDVRKADLIAAPGCYPTSAILPLRPLAMAGAIRTGIRPIVDSVSGVSGAGRTPSARGMFCEVSMQPYGVLSHRHGPEIDAYSGVGVVFTPHLGPYDRGILSTMHVELASGWDEGRVRGVLEGAYAGEAFVRVLPAGVWPSVNDVRGTNFCDIACAVDAVHGHLILVSAIDNLVKGAAGQAVQAMNVRCGVSESAGLAGRTI